jgi:RNA polymerase sigma-70 factor (ECF subfamily)
MNRAIDSMRRWRPPSHRLDRSRREDEPTELGPLVERLASPEPGPLEHLQERERQGWVRESLARLPEPLRLVLVLAYDRELSYAEIAVLLDIPLGTVKSRLHGAIARLRAIAEEAGRAGRR